MALNLPRSSTAGPGPEGAAPRRPGAGDTGDEAGPATTGPGPGREGSTAAGGGDRAGSGRAGQPV